MPRTETAEANAHWSIEPNFPGDDANSRHREGSAHQINPEDDNFVTVYSVLDHTQSGIPKKIQKLLVSGYNVQRFIDKANPFYWDDKPMFAVKEYMVDGLIHDLNERGYEAEIRNDVSQFSFTPRPTVGEVVITEKCKDAELFE